MLVIKRTIYLFVIALVFYASTASAQLFMPNFSNEGIEEQVKNYFSDAQEMVAIAKCESGFRQYNNSGMPLSGGASGNYIGVFQISRGHSATATAMGWDIYTPEGNLAYAKYLYQRQGTAPWVGCVKSPVKISNQTTALISSSTLDTLTINLKMGMVNPQVIILQKKLNALGFAVAGSGPGSPGQETNQFGLLTKQAVQRFQCERKIVCSGNELSTGYGRVGPLTRSFLTASAQ